MTKIGVDSRPARASEKGGFASRRGSIVTLGGILLLLVIAALGLWSLGGRPGVSQGAVAQGRAIEPVRSSDGPPASDFSLRTLDGGTFTLSEHKGHVVVLYFMASWCGTCVAEARNLARLYEQYKDQGLTVVAINLEPEENVEGLKQFRALANNGAYTWAFDTGFAVAQAYNVRTLDTTIIVDRSGRIAYQDAIPTPMSILEAELQKWL